MIRYTKLISNLFKRSIVDQLCSDLFVMRRCLVNLRGQSLNVKHDKSSMLTTLSDGEI